MKDLLESGSYTLTDLLNSDEVLQEVKSLDPLLLSYLTKRGVLRDIVGRIVDSEDDGGVVDSTGMVVEEGEEEREEKEKEKEKEDNIDNNDETDESHSASPTSYTSSIPDSTNARVRHPYMCCEIICCDAAPIIDGIVDFDVVGGGDDDDDNGGNGGGSRVVDGKEKETVSSETIKNDLLDRLVSVLDRPPPIPSRTAGYFEKVMTALFTRRPLTMSRYVNTLPAGTFEKFAAHVGSYSVMSLVKRMMTPRVEDEDGDDDICDGVDDGQAWQIGPGCMSPSMKCDWSKSPTCVSAILSAASSPSSSVAYCVNACDLVIAVVQHLRLDDHLLIKISSEGGEERARSPLSQIIEMSFPSPPISEALTRYDTKMSSGLGVLEAVLLQLGGYGCVSPLDDGGAQGEDGDRQQPREIATCEGIVRIIRESGKLQVAVEAMEGDRGEEWTQVNQEGETVPVFGITRLKLVRVIEAMVILESPEMDDLLSSSAIIASCVRAFFKFSWCSLLHQSVANMLVHVIEGGNKRATLQDYLINDLGIIPMLLDCFEGEEGADPNQPAKHDQRTRKGLMGHVIIICQAIVHAWTEGDGDWSDSGQPYSGQPSIPSRSSNNFARTLESSDHFERWQEFASTKLSDETIVQSTPLGGGTPPRQDMSDEDFGLDSHDVDAAATMIASLNMAASGAGGGVKLGMDGLTFNSGIGAFDGSQEDSQAHPAPGHPRLPEIRVGDVGYGGPFADDPVDNSEVSEMGSSSFGVASSALGGTSRYFDDIINNVNGRKNYDVGEDDVVEVIHRGSNGSDDEQHHDDQYQQGQREGYQSSSSSSSSSSDDDDGDDGDHENDALDVPVQNLFAKGDVFDPFGMNDKGVGATKASGFAPAQAWSESESSPEPAQATGGGQSFQANFADFADMRAKEEEEEEEFGGFDSSQGDVGVGADPAGKTAESIPPRAAEGGGGGGGGWTNCGGDSARPTFAQNDNSKVGGKPKSNNDDDACAEEDPFDDLARSSSASRNDFFGS